jgi:hypothetical protein
MADQQVQIVITALEQAKAVIQNVVKDLNGIGTAGSTANTSLTKTGTALKGVEAAAGSVSAKLKEMAAYLLAAFTVEKLIQYTTSALEGAHATEELSKAVGVSADTMRRLEDTAGRSQVSTEQFAVAARTLNKVLVDAQEHGSKYEQIFDRMGIATTNAAGKIRPFESVLMEVSDKFRLYAEGANKSALAQELFGSRSTAMIALLNLGSDEIKRRMQESKGLTEEQLKLASDYAEMTFKLQQLTTQLGFAIGSALVPALKNLVDSFSGAMDKGGGFKTLTNDLMVIVKDLAAAFVVVASSIMTAWDALNSFAKAAGNLSSMLSVQALAHPLDFVLGAQGRNSQVTAIKDATNEMQSFADRTRARFAEVKSVVDALTGSITKVGEAAKTAGGAGQTGSKSGSGATAGVGMMEAPSILDNTKRLKQDIAELDAKRSQAELTYQTELTNSEAAVKRGDISKTDADRLDQQAAVKLEADLSAINDAIQKQIDKLKEAIELYKKLHPDATPEDIAASFPQAAELQTKLGQGQAQQAKAAGIANTPGPDDWAGNMKVQMQQLKDQFATTAQSIAASMKNTIGGAMKQLSAGIGDMIVDGKKFGQVWADTGKTVAKAIINMASEYIAGKLAMMAVDAVMHKASTAQSAQTAASSGTAGVAKAGEQGGWVGLLLYLVVFAAVLAAIMALAGAATGFAAGGPVVGGVQGQDSVPAMLTPGEFVIPKASVDKFGAAHFEMYRRGETPGIDDMMGVPAPVLSGFFSAGGLVGAGSTVGQQPRDSQVSMAFVNTRSDLREFMAGEGSKMVVDYLSQRSNRIKA